MTRIFHRTLSPQPRLAVRGEGIHIYDSDGREYMDACGGAAVSCLGHGDAEVLRAMAAQAERLAYAHTSFFTTEAAEELAELLTGDGVLRDGRVYFVCDGSEAAEAAFKMAHQYHRLRGEPGRNRIIARWQSYHGATLGALAAGGNEARRAMFEGLLSDNVGHIDPCYAYRGRRPDESLTEYGLRTADQLEEKILALGPETVSCFVAETVAGATLGAVPPAPGYFRRVREICDRYGVLLVLDEVMCGLGRCGTQHACEAEGIEPDLELLAKGLGAGYQPLGAVVASGKVFAAFNDAKSDFVHGHSFLAHPVACAAALAVQRAVIGRDLLRNVRERGEQLAAGLRRAFGGHPHVGDIRGRGLFQGVELVRDRETAEPFDPSLKLHSRLKASAMNHGLMIYAMGGTVDGARGNHFLLAPPYNVTADEVDEILSRLERAVADCFARLEVTPRRARARGES